jgi:hypothetical protein
MAQTDLVCSKYVGRRTVNNIIMKVNSKGIVTTVQPDQPLAYTRPIFVSTRVHISRTTNHAKQIALLRYASKHLAAKRRFGGKLWAGVCEQVSRWPVYAQIGFRVALLWSWSQGGCDRLGHVAWMGEKNNAHWIVRKRLEKCPLNRVRTWWENNINLLKLKLIKMIFKNLVCTAKKTPHFTITDICWLMLFRVELQMSWSAVISTWTLRYGDWDRGILGHIWPLWCYRSQTRGNNSGIMVVKVWFFGMALESI